MKEEENNADEKENSSEIEKAEFPLKVKKSLSHLKATFTFFQEVMIGAAAGTSMLIRWILVLICIIEYYNV